MCVDYTDLNKHYPKDPFSLPRIDKVVDSIAGCELFYFLDCYSSYHQISLKGGGPDQNILHYVIWRLLLHHHVLWTQKCWCDISEGHSTLP